MNESTKFLLYAGAWIVSVILASVLGWKKGYDDSEKDSKLVDSFTEKPKKRKDVDLRRLNYRVVEREIDGKTKWVAQHKTKNDEWVDCYGRQGLVARDTGSSARHWFFWEEGCKQFPDAGTDGQEVYRFNKDGTRVLENDEC